MKLVWEKLNDHWNDKSLPEGHTYRAQIPGGWLVSVWAGPKLNQQSGGGLTFVPDAGHLWDAELEELNG